MIVVVEDERVYRSTFEAALIGIAQTSLDGRFLRVNPYLCGLLGYAADELTAMNFAAVSHPDDVDDDLDARRALIAGDLDRYSREKRYRTKSGTFVRTQLTVSVYRGPDARPEYFIAIIEDITARKAIEQQLRQTQKMEAIGRLAGGIAHDFNNLLTAIVGYADLALNQVRRDDPLHQDLQSIRKAGESAASLTRQLLAFSRKQMLQPQIVDLNGVVSRMNTLLRRLIGEQIQLDRRLVQPVARVSADPGQIEQVILNLALNARDAMPGGGTLSIETANVTLDAAYVAAHPGSSEGPHVMLAIGDTGVGMDRATQEHLFEPFYTTKELGKGTGLGLATVYGIIRQSGGSIVVDSERGRGTSIKVFLPKAEHGAETLDEPQAPGAAMAGTETILLVEDQREVRSVVHQMLARHGYTVVSAADGAEALDAARRHGRPIDLLVTDVVMPGMGSRVLVERLLSHQPQTRVLYMSGYTDDAVVQQGVLERSVAFIQKPFAAPALLQKIREVLERDDASR
jgi:two-component system cell cycle sensor histidine kinase/response regulator CckA